MLSNNEIVEYYLNNGLMRKCIDYQFMKIDKTYKEDLFNDLIIEILEYDNAKLNDVHEHNHFNAFFTRLIQNNIYSKTSWFYRRYKKYDMLSDEITKKEMDIADEC